MFDITSKSFDFYVNIIIIVTIFNTIKKENIGRIFLILKNKIIPSKRSYCQF